jgi:DNA-binding Lrp family transcriptional regulator/uncharacterized membrane protein
VQQLADAAGLSSTPCWKRVKEMEASGIIRGYTALVDREKVGLTLCVLAEVNLTRHNEDDVRRFEQAVADCAADRQLLRDHRPGRLRDQGAGAGHQELRELPARDRVQAAGRDARAIERGAEGSEGRNAAAAGAIADTTAIGFTTPIFIMLGAVLLFKEPLRWERCLAAAIGFAGVLIVVAPKLTGAGGWYSLVMLSSSPVFAASFLITKALTRYERPEVIVAWQAITVTLLSLPLALLHWQMPSAGQWLLFLVCGLLGSSAHYCLTRSFATADISATQSVKFLDLVWATLLGWLVFGDTTTASTLLGGAVICASTLWIARRETRGPR